jgi:hypothetical protein
MIGALTMRNEIRNELGFTENYLKKIWDKDTFETFLKFMYGQTVGIIENHVTYYYLDVHNFCKFYNVTYPA